MSELKFKDISTEDFREYEFPDMTIRIENPKQLNVSKSGGHRVIDGNGESHYVPSGWRRLHWKAEPPFSF
jgi:hypothetical protein